jgi:hypothetical protein
VLQQRDTYNHHFSYSYTQHERNEFHTGELTGPDRSTFFCLPQFCYSEIGLVFSNIRLTQYQSHLISGIKSCSSKYVNVHVAWKCTRTWAQTRTWIRIRTQTWTPPSTPHTHWQTLPLLYQIAVVIVSKILRQTKFQEIPPREFFPGQPAVHRTHVHSWSSRKVIAVR